MSDHELVDEVRETRIYERTPRRRMYPLQRQDCKNNSRTYHLVPADSTLTCRTLPPHDLAPNGGRR